MKIKALLLLVPFVLLAGCGDFTATTNPISDYYYVTASSASAGYTVYYSLTSVDTSISNGYSVTQTLPTLSYTLLTSPKEQVNNLILPQITFNKMKVVYSVIGDSQGVITAGWAPQSFEAGVSVTIPGGVYTTGGSTSGETTAQETTAQETTAPATSVVANLALVASNSLATQVFNKIGSVTSTLNPSGAYAFSMSLSTALTVKADVTLTGVDERGTNISLPFSTTITFGTKI